MPRPIRATIDLSALRHNQSVARRLAHQARVWSVIKADAYGHGLLRTAGALAGVTDGFALLDLAEAVTLRESGLRHPILLLEGFFESEDLPVVAEYGLTPVLHSLDQIEMLTMASLPVRVPVYVKVNTGMNRLGFAPEAVPAVITALETARQVASITFMTHFADADSEEPGITEQLARFRDAVSGFSHPVSLSNSASLVRFPEARGDWVRPGIMLYGASPCPRILTAAQIGLRPAMTLSSEIIAVHELEPGDRVGYGGIFTADAPTRLGVVACGYADGYSRHAPTGTPVLVEGVRTRTLGRVSMDMLCVDLTAIPRAGVGSPVVLWGEGLPADEVAESAGTISYELFCALARRVRVVEA